MFGKTPQQAHKVRPHVHRLNAQAIDRFPVRDQFRLAEKGRDEMQATHGQPLFHQQPGRQNAVQPAGKQRDGVRACRHCVRFAHCR